MATVLLTRPAHESQKLGARLQSLGYKTLIDPLLTIVEERQTRPELNGIGAVILTSGNAVHALQGRREQSVSLLGLPCFCVGTMTAEMATRFGFRHVIDAQGNGRALAALLKAEIKRDGNSPPLLYLAGRDRDPTLENELKEVGLSVVTWVVYAAEASRKLSDATVRALNEKEITTLLIFSARTADIFKDLLAAARLQACCRDLTAIGISPNANAPLADLPWYRLYAADQPTEDAVIACLTKWVPTSEAP